MSTPEDRAAYIAGMRRLMDILEANPDLPLPEQHHQQPVTWWMVSAGPREIAAVESILGGPLAGHIDPEHDNWFNLDGELGGMRIRIRGWATSVAERRVTGTRTVEDVEWVRLPAEDPAGSADEDEEPQS
jgi:hypothetical protein